MEKVLERKLIGSLHGLKHGTKTPQDVITLLNKFRKVNPYLYEDYYNKYKNLVIETN